MISSYLFRPGDRLHFRHDLHTHTEYVMIHDEDINCQTGSAEQWVADNKGKDVVIEGMSGIDRYTANGIFCLTDTIFDEGERIAKYLNTTRRCLF